MIVLAVLSVVTVLIVAVYVHGRATSYLRYCTVANGHGRIVVRTHYTRIGQRVYVAYSLSRGYVVLQSRIK